MCVVEAIFHVGVKTGPSEFFMKSGVRVREVWERLREEDEWYPILDGEKHRYEVGEDVNWCESVRRKLGCLGREFPDETFTVAATLLWDGLITVYNVRGSRVMIVEKRNRETTTISGNVTYHSVCMPIVNNSISTLFANKPNIIRTRHLTRNLFLTLRGKFIVRDHKNGMYVLGVLREGGTETSFPELDMNLSEEERRTARLMGLVVDSPTSEEIQALRLLNIEVRGQ